MLTLKRLAIYLITFLITAILLLSVGNWKQIDTFITAYSNKTIEDQPIVNNDIVFVDLAPDMLGESTCAIIQKKRQKVVDMLDAFSYEAEINKGPKAVVLDLWFSRDSTQRNNIIRAIKNLQDLRTPVYAAYNINASNENNVEIDSIGFDNLEANHDVDIYNALSSFSDSVHLGSGRYHAYSFPITDVAFYEFDYQFKSEFSELIGDENPYILIESLALKVVTDLEKSKTRSYEKKRRGSIIPMASLDEITSNSYMFFPDSTLTLNSFVSSKEGDFIDLDNKIVVVGDPQNDVVDLGKEIVPGPYILTWAISDLLDYNIRLKLPIENTALIIGQMLFFAFFVVFIYALLFKYIKRLQTKPILIAILSFLSSLCFVFVYYKVILSFNAVIPVGQTIATMLVTAFLSWHFAYKFLTTGVAEGSEKYDVFISYSHGNSDWVKKNVFEPLDSFRTPKGNKLKIFFDVNSIAIGEPFTSKYMWGIVDSKVFIPIISEEYYGKNHCKNEMDLAYKRSVEKLLDIKPITFSYECVPDIYTHINFVDITVNKDFIAAIKESLIEHKGIA